MSEAEMLEHFWNAQEIAVNAFLAYITILSSYLVVAFIVGEHPLGVIPSKARHWRMGSGQS